jgi:homoserine dehydrogenase
VLAEIATLFSEHGVSVEAVQQSVHTLALPDLGTDHGAAEVPSTATLVIGTHEATESALAATVASLQGTDSVAEVTSVLRVEGL